jgi:hypothetical protein
MCDKKEGFFSEEKKQKTFAPDACGNAQAMAGTLERRREIKVFWFFFRKERLL